MQWLRLWLIRKDRVRFSFRTQLDAEENVQLGKIWRQETSWKQIIPQHFIWSKTAFDFLMLLLVNTTKSSEMLLHPTVWTKYHGPRTSDILVSTICIQSTLDWSSFHKESSSLILHLRYFSPYRFHGNKDVKYIGNKKEAGYKLCFMAEHQLLSTLLLQLFQKSLSFGCSLQNYMYFCIFC